MAPDRPLNMFEQLHARASSENAMRLYRVWRYGGNTEKTIELLTPAQVAEYREQGYRVEEALRERGRKQTKVV